MLERLFGEERRRTKVIPHAFQGSYTLTAVATDNQNATTTSAPVSISVGVPATMYFIQADHLNTPRVVTNQSGQAVLRWDQQEPFGVNPADENPSALGNFDLPLRLPGQYFDKETNLHYNYFRDYDPGIGRFVQGDPIGLAGGVNTFAYAVPNPLGTIDPLGLQADPLLGIGSEQAATFFTMTTFAAAQRTYTVHEAVEAGSLFRSVTAPSIIAGGIPYVLQMGGQAAVVTGVACRALPEVLPKALEACRNPLLAAALGASICGSTAGTVRGSAREFVRTRERLDEIREASERVRRSNDARQIIR
jgi:RHS repeat-associated protein